MQIGLQMFFIVKDSNVVYMVRQQICVHLLIGKLGRIDTSTSKMRGFHLQDYVMVSSLWVNRKCQT
jgi:hypothetical protein